MQRLFNQSRNQRTKTPAVLGLCWSLFLKKLHVWRSATTTTKVLSREHCEIKTTTYFEKHRLLFDCFNGSLLHAPKVSRSRLYDGVELQGLSLLFLSRHLLSWTETQPALENLRRIPLMSQLSFFIGYFWSF